MRNLLVKVSPFLGRMTGHILQSVPNAFEEARGLTNVAISACTDEIERIQKARELTRKFYEAQVKSQKSENIAVLESNTLNPTPTGSPTVEEKAVVSPPVHTSNGIPPVPVHPDLTPV